MFSTVFKTYFLIQCTLFYHKYNYVVAIRGPNVREAEENEFPGVVSIVTLTNYTGPNIEINHQCTGTLVSRQDILTAEHCLSNTYTDGFKVMAGSRDIREAIAFYSVFIWTFESWNHYTRRNDTQAEHDIAFIKISANIPENINFAPTANMPNEQLHGLQVDIAGWGAHINGTVVRILRTGKIQILTTYQCQTRYLIMRHVFLTLHERYLCSIAEPYVLLTEGDSGGPVFFFGTLVAVSKAVFPLGELGFLQTNLMNLHMSLRYYRVFFNDVISRFHINF